MSNQANNVNFVVKSNLCCSCGLCSNYCKQKAITYKINKLGFYIPSINKSLCTGCKVCLHNCPGINDLKNYNNSNEETCFGYSKNKELRLNAASGGITTELLCYLISKQHVDYVTCVTTRTYKNNPEQIITNDLNIIKKAKTSKYCPVQWNNIIPQIEKLNGSIAIIALPCQINSLKKYFSKRKSGQNIKYWISLLCNHTPSLYAANYIAQGYGGKGIKLRQVVNRGGGFPGYMTYTIEKDNQKIQFQTPYRKSWHAGYGLYFKNLRCILCNDPFAKNADIVMGDSYFPQDTDTLGTTFCIIRNPEIKQILHEMKEENIISLENGPDDALIKKYYKVLFDREKEFQLKNKYLKLLHHQTVNSSFNKKDENSQITLRNTINFYKHIFISSLGKHKCLWSYLGKKHQLKNLISNIKFK